jgi:hypothetical protein
MVSGRQFAIALKTALEINGKGSRLYADAMANALAVHLLSQYSAHRQSIKNYAGRLSEQKTRTACIAANSIRQGLVLQPVTNQ